MPGRVKRFVSSPNRANRPDPLWDLLSSFSTGNRCSFHHSERAADRSSLHSSPPTEEFKDEWSYNSSPDYAVKDCARVNSLLLYFKQVLTQFSFKS
jgi:hypothetical protein